MTIMYRIAASSAMLDAQSNVALIIHARRIRELVRLEVHPGLRLVLVIRKLSHDLAVDRTTANERVYQIIKKKESMDRSFRLSRYYFLSSSSY